MIMNISVLVLDDHQEQATELTNLLNKIPYITTIKVITNPVEALNHFLTEKIDLVFLNMEMAEIHGLELLASFQFPPTIVISSDSTFAIDCFDNNSVVDFIERPVRIPRLMRALSRAIKHISMNMLTNEHLYLKTGRKIQNFKIDTIQYIEADGIYCKVWVSNGTFSHVNDNITEIENKLRHTRLIRLHKSYIFNLNYMDTFNSRNIWIGEKQFSLGVMYRSKLGDILNINSSYE